MKLTYLAGLVLLANSALLGEPATYLNFIRQTQYPSGTDHDTSHNLPVAGSADSNQPIDPGGARFELWTIRQNPLKSYLLNHTYVSAYTPIADVTIRTEDVNAPSPRTRADRPFWVDVKVDGLMDDFNAPEAAKKVNLIRYVQEYGPDGDETMIDRDQATQISQAYLNANQTYTFSYSLSSVPGSDLTKLRGEERFSVYSLQDGTAPPSQIHSETIQIWPMADGQINGIVEGQEVKYKFPVITITFNDIYPSGSVYAQVYPGPHVLGTEGTVVPGAAWNPNSLKPESGQLPVDLDQMVEEDGLWTLELITTSPFDKIVLDHVSFPVDRTIRVNAAVTTIE